MVLIGSSAIKYWYSDFPREPKDIDVIGDEYNGPHNHKFAKKTEWLENPVLSDYLTNTVKGTNYLNPNLLFTLKISHLFWDINWDKHMFDVMFLRDKGCIFNRDLFNKLYQYWIKIHGKTKKSNLNLKVDEFFDNAINCDIEHDEIHKLINPNPTYLKILKNDGTVATDDDKFNQLSYEDKMNLIIEECMVMAYERLASRDFRSAYKWMLKKLIINHLTLEEGLFAIMNYKELHLPKFNYVKLIENEKRSNKYRSIK